MMMFGFIFLSLLFSFVAEAQTNVEGSYFEKSENYAIHIDGDRFVVLMRDTNTYLVDTIASANYKVSKKGSLKLSYSKNVDSQGNTIAGEGKIKFKNEILKWRGMEFKKEVVYDVVEEMPSFPGGNGELMEYISKNIHYPTEALEKGFGGHIVIRFIVKKDGSIGYIYVYKNANGPLNKEFVRVIQSMPKWNPGIIEGKAVDVRFTIPLNIRPQ